MRNFDFSPLFRSTIGFDHLDRLLDAATRENVNRTSYPPYNIEKMGEDNYRISMAVAGFREDELDVTMERNVLIVSGRSEDQTPEGTTVLHRGIAKRAFEHRFELADTIKVKDASLENGVLSVELVREVPEHLKPRQIKIGSGKRAESRVIEGKKAA
jgi:molecular chaperone IbpA